MSEELNLPLDGIELSADQKTVEMRSHVRDGKKAVVSVPLDKFSAFAKLAAVTERHLSRSGMLPLARSERPALRPAFMGDHLRPGVSP